MEKTCVKCGLVKLLDEYSNRRGTQKHSWCKPCVNEYRREVYFNKEKGRPDYQQRKYRQRAESNARHPDRALARQLAMKYKKMIKKDACEHCGATDRLHMHHKDYSRPLDVVTLCRTCHDKLHFAPIPAS